ncbi:hypothetical protein [Candidatus Vampirococcus lugosii]|uniref:DUF2262 domain-containing protein n=1 Tax=Candidatus Vampirococcus lugosii TaxID=2789015 RepID=A0ABS5QJR6_9BACT|nr:hypothetical protein [Candidatus Vampirococcus lugosii]MBS8121510.1 hypothetical protein [Candidatus Vampirococcus lugosii]
MTKEEILNKINWDNYGIGNCKIFINLFDKEIPFIFFKEDDLEISITDKMIESVNNILMLDKSNLDIIKKMLWEECQFSFTIGDYGCELKEGETNLDTNLKHFGVLNKEDSYLKSKIKEIHICEENDILNGCYSEIKIDSISDNLISIIIKNGKIIDFDYNGTYLGWFDKDEQYAKNARARVLK